MAHAAPAQKRAGRGEGPFSTYHEDNFLFAQAAKRPLPVVVVTGFLGSGKTTLMEKLLEARGNLRVTAIVHDLAATNVDAAFLGDGMVSDKTLRRADVATRDGAVVGMEGCSCCPEFDDALKVLVKSSLFEGVDQGFLDYLVLETSGAADPRRLISSLEQHFGPCTRARLDRVVAMVDAEAASSANWLTGDAANTDEVVQRVQLNCADVVVLNKVDLVEPDARALAEARLREICPHARVLTCSFGKVSIAEVLEVSEAPAEANAAASHEMERANFFVPQDLEPKPRSVGAADSAPPLLGTAHGLRHRVIEWSAPEGRPVHLARFQEFLACSLPLWSRSLRRGKGVLWVAEDKPARWEWQLSGRLRFSSRRDPAGFSGASPFSCLVLIFASDVATATLVSARAALDLLVEPPSAPLESWPEGEADFAEQRIAQAEAQLSAADFEMLLPPPDVLDGAVRFRATGRAKFSIESDVNLAEQPYCIDLDAINVELARLVSTAQGGSFLGVGRGVCQNSGQDVASLLWPADAGACAEAPTLAADGGVPPPPKAPIFDMFLDVLRAEADQLLKQSFAHVQSCRCGQ